MSNTRPPSFWDVDQYRRVIKRIENGYRSCDNFLSMVQERAEIEVRYAKSVRKWTEKWSAMVEKGSEYGSTLEAWRSCLQEGTIVAQVHEDCKIKIMGEDGPFYNMYKWKKEHYHKGAFGSLQEAREANDGFAAAQKEFARLLAKSERARKAYHSACVAAHKARLFAEEETLEDSVRPEFRRKIQQRAVKLTSQQEKVKQRYLKRVTRCNGPAKDRYAQEMTGEITKWQSLERSRLDTIHAQLILFVRSLDCGSPYKASGFEHLEELYRRLEESIGLADSVRDVQDWDSRYGTGCEQHWPQFEEMDIEELDAAAYAEVERKTSFGNAIMQRRRRQRPQNRRSRQTMYSSGTDFDEEDDFSSDSFDSSSTDVESVTRVQEPVRVDQTYSQVAATHVPQQQISTHASQQQFMPGYNPGGHRTTQYHHQQLLHRHQPSQLYGHHVAELSQHYGGQMHRQAYPLDETSSHISTHRVGETSSGYRRAEKEISDHVSAGHRRRSRHSQRHSRHDQQSYSQKERSPRQKAYSPTQWHSTHAWHPVPYENTRDSNTPPTRDVENPAKNVQPQTSMSTAGNYLSKITEHVLSPSDHSGTSMTRTYHQHVHVPAQSSSQYNGHQPEQGVSNYSRQSLTSERSQQIVTPQTQANYVANYQHATPEDKQMTPTPTSWQHTQSTNVVGVTVSTQSPSVSSTVWQQQTTPTTTPTTTTTTTPQQRTDLGSKLTPSSHRHERHTTLDQAKHMLHLEEGEFMIRALYDFTASTRDEIPLKRGEVLVQKGKHSQNGWAFGRNLEKSGIFPASYVQVVR